MLRIIIVLMMLLVVVSGVSATNYYMSPTGNDASNGETISTTWANLSHAQTVLAPGDTLLVVDGTYTNDIFKAQINGTAVNPIIICAYNGTPTFISTTAGTLRCFNFHDTNRPGAATHPIEHYIVDGLRFENYERAIDICYESSYITASNITSDNCTSPFFVGGDCHDIVSRDMILNGSQWNAWYLWHDNYNITATDVYVTNQVEHSFFDLHTNNDNITLTNCRADTSSDDAPGIYMGHGDYGTDDDVTIINFTYIDVPLARAIEAWNAGDNLYVDGLHSTGSKSVNIGAGTNATLKNAYIEHCVGSATHGVYVSNTMDEILLENITLINIDYQGVKYELGWDNATNVTMRNWYGDDMDYQIWIGEGVASGYHRLEYSDGTVFSGTAGHSDVRYYPENSSIELINYTSPLITYYDITLRPTNSYLKDVVINHKSDAEDDRTNITVNSSVSSNPTWISATMQNTTHNYSVSVDGVIVDYVNADSAGVVRYQHTLSWSPHDFEFNWISGTTNNNIVLLGNQHGMLRKNVLSAETFSNIAAEIDHDQCYTWWDDTSDRWESYRVGYSYNADKYIPAHNSYFVLVDNVGTTIVRELSSAETITIPIGWYATYLRENTHKTLSEIKADMGGNVVDLYAFNSTAAMWTDTETYSVQPNQGLLINASNSFDWDGSVE